MAPVLPGLTDGEEAIAAVAKAAQVNGASPCEAGARRLAPLVKEHYLGFVAATVPELSPRYERAYAGATGSSDYPTAIAHTGFRNPAGSPSLGSGAGSRSTSTKHTDTVNLP